MMKILEWLQAVAEVATLQSHHERIFAKINRSDLVRWGATLAAGKTEVLRLRLRKKESWPRMVSAKLG